MPTRSRQTGPKFKLLSEDAFVLARYSQSCEQKRRVPGDSYGFLDVYQFNPQSNDSEQPTRVASFTLPPLGHQYIETTLFFRCDHAGVKSVPTSLPKVFDLACDNWLLCLDIHVDVRSSPFSQYSAGTLCIPSSLLLGSLPKHQTEETYQRGCITVPWAEWAENTSWLDSYNTSDTGRLFLSGQRIVVQLPGWVLDFDPRRLQSRHTLSMPAGGVVLKPGEKSTVSPYFYQVGKEMFCYEPVRPRRRYVETKIRVPKDGRECAVRHDDEHRECMHVQTSQFLSDPFHDLVTTLSDINRGQQ